MGKKIDFDKEVGIDIDKLHEEWLAQSNLFLNAMKEEAEREKEKDEARMELDAVKAEMKELVERKRSELFKQIKLNPKKYGLLTEKEKGDKDKSRVTDSAINAVIYTHEEYIAATEKSAKRIRRAQQDHIDASYIYNLTHGAVKALDQKKAALEHLVFLWHKGYWSDPRELKGGRKDFEEDSIRHVMKSHSEGLKNKLLKRRQEED